MGVQPVGGVKVRVLSGPYSGGLYEPDGATPLELLESFMQHRWQWQLFYVPDAEPAEIQDWLQADMLVRVMQRPAEDSAGDPLMGE